MSIFVTIFLLFLVYSFFNNRADVEKAKKEKEDEANEMKRLRELDHYEKINECCLEATEDTRLLLDCENMTVQYVVGVDDYLSVFTTEYRFRKNEKSSESLEWILWMREENIEGKRKVTLSARDGLITSAHEKLKDSVDPETRRLYFDDIEKLKREISTWHEVPPQVTALILPKLKVYEAYVSKYGIPKSE